MNEVCEQLVYAVVHFEAGESVTTIGIVFNRLNAAVQATGFLWINNENIFF